MLKATHSLTDSTIQMAAESQETNCKYTSVLAKEWKSGAPPLLGIQFSFDVVERM